MNGVCGSRMDSVVPSLTTASFSMSPVDFVTSSIVVVRAIAALVSVCVVRVLRRCRSVVVFELILVARWVMAAGDWSNVTSRSDVMRSVRSNL